MNSADRAAVQSRIGYSFNNEKLLDAAFTHSSYINEHNAVCNERIEFLGDCVLNFSVGERLFFGDRTASEGALSARRAALVSRAPLARIVDGLGLIEFLRVGAGVNKSAFSAKTRSDLFEAILGAVYLDGGFDACKQVLDVVFYPNVKPERDYKSELQEYATERALTPVYTVEACDTGYKATVTVGDGRYTGTAKRKHSAEIAAAKVAVANLIKE